jgi:hypothetical protein
MNEELKSLLNQKYGMRTPTISWFDYSTVYASLEELVEAIKSYACIADVWEDLGVTLVEIADNNMWSGGLVVLGSPSTSAIDKARKESWNTFYQNGDR